MFAFIEKARFILSLLPVIIGAIQALEEAIPGSGKGEEKLAAVRAALESVYSTGGDVFDSFEEAWPIIESTIGSLVSLFNKVGWSK